MRITRRDLLKFAAGSTAGILLTPAPWKVLDDSAIWTQNWPWIPRPTSGESRNRYTTCALCPAGCGIRARCIAGQPVSLAGVEGHPASRTLCTVGLGAHHLPYHPSRLTNPVRVSQRMGAVETTPVSLDEAIAAIAQAISSRGASAVAVLDERPGRVISMYYRNLMASFPGGVYLVPPGSEGTNAGRYDRLAGGGYGPVGYDIEHAATIVSFGAPILDGWGSPGRMARILRRKPQIIQIETRLSRTAARAHRWVPLYPGSETAFALTLAHVLVKEGLSDRAMVRKANDFDGADGSCLRGLLEHCSPAATAPVTGISAEDAVTIARAIGTERPAIVVGGGDPGGGPLGESEEQAIAILNLLLGSVGTLGGLLPRHAREEDAASTIAAAALDTVPDRSIGVLLLDAAESGNAVPWPLIERKLASHEATVISMSPFLAGHAKRATWIIPSPASLEQWDDLPASLDRPAESWSVSVPLLAPPAGCCEPVDLVQRLAAATGRLLVREGDGPTLCNDLKARAATLYNAGKGSVFTPATGQVQDLREVPSQDAFWTLLTEGACWTDAAVSGRGFPRFRFFPDTESYQRLLAAAAGRVPPPVRSGNTVLVMPFGWRGTAGSAQFSPLMTKLYQESGLREGSGVAFMHPETAARLHCADNGTTTFTNAYGSLRVGVRIDRGVMPGVAHLAVGPEPEGFRPSSEEPRASVFSLWSTEKDTPWRVLQAEAREA